ncbi:MAG: DUF4505 family protein [Leptospiraceae bacterium]|nr:DUF4505 family protein [Leptospiraceae bacterium]MDW7975268.1 DUF4505 family protein [Leptospiraceae bacterium]
MKFERYYFYYVDFDGNLYHDNTLLTDEKFLDFFFKQIQYNQTQMFENYPYLSPCGKEANFIACPDTPIVFRKIEDQKLYFAGSLSIPFDETKLAYVETSGLLYHHWKDNLYGRLGKYVMMEIANEISLKEGKYFYKERLIPTYFSFQDLIFKKFTKL